MLNVVSQRFGKYALQGINRKAKQLPSRKVLYFAYGANMDASLLTKKSVFPTRSAAAELQGYRIEISSPCEMKGKGFASVAESPTASVFGVLHEVSSLELAILDLLEWVPFRFHRRIRLPVKLLDGSEAALAWVYVARHPRSGLMTSTGYRDLLVRSAGAFGLPQDYIEELAALPVATSFTFDHGFRLSNPGKRRWFERSLKSIYKVHDVWREKLCERLP